MSIFTIFAVLTHSPPATTSLQSILCACILQLILFEHFKHMYRFLMMFNTWHRVWWINVFYMKQLMSVTFLLGASRANRSGDMMMSSNGNIFHVTGPLWGESTGHRWIPLTKASDAELWCFLWSVPEQTVEQTIETPVIWDAILLIMASL